MEETINLKLEKEKINKYMKILSIFLSLTFIFISIIGLSILIPDLILDKKTSNSSNLGGFGSYMNVLIAITSTITVGLVFYGVRVQSLEFKTTRTQLQKQINLQNEENKTDRAFQLHSEWLRIRENDAFFIEFNEAIPTKKEKIYIGRIATMYRNENIEKHVNKGLLTDLLKTEGISMLIENEIKRIYMILGEREDITLEDYNDVGNIMMYITNNKPNRELGTLLSELLIMMIAHRQIF
ncbi:MAG: hypothetical protein R3F02_19190 [Thiolinea sp.]